VAMVLDSPADRLVGTLTVVDLVDCVADLLGRVPEQSIVATLSLHTVSSWKAGMLVENCILLVPSSWSLSYAAFLLAVTVCLVRLLVECTSSDCSLVSIFCCLSLIAFVQRTAGVAVTSLREKKATATFCTCLRTCRSSQRAALCSKPRPTISPS